MNHQGFAHGGEFAGERCDVDLMCDPGFKLADWHVFEQRAQALSLWFRKIVVVKGRVERRQHRVGAEGEFSGVAASTPSA